MANHTANTPAGPAAAEKDNGDHLGYGVYAQTLWVRVEAALNKDQGDPDRLGDDPLVVGIFGEWGAGKSKLLSLILKLANQKRDTLISAHQQDDGFSLTVPVFFQPWKYEHEKHLLVPLLLHIEAELSQCLKKAQSANDKAKGGALVVAEKVKAHLPALIGGFKNLLGAARTAYQLAEPASAGVLLPLAEWLAGRLDGPKKPGEDPIRDFRWDSESGRSFYELHDILKAVTRPTADSLKERLPEAKIDSSFHINFVIFIDDLDRCLPEKAVETLELIKTVFNLESFAFVLALDEEVVERGIGHRYKDYALVNKKPEMPITGFEYLEKIVHLPFRLPALTDAQALAFLARHESQLLHAQAQRRWPLALKDQGVQAEKDQWLKKRRWLSEPRTVLIRDALDPDGRYINELDEVRDPVPAPATGAGKRRIKSVSLQRLNLAEFVVRCFNAHVPRKLIRVVELFNQVQDVLEAMSPPKQLELGGELDPRQVLALLLLQLFQPDLYRSLRRSGDTFELFLDAFRPVDSRETNASRPRRQLSAATSDADLLHWAVYFLDEQPPVSLRAAQQRIPRLDIAERHATQHKRLPLVERLLEHRSIQRHPFDPMKLMHELVQADQLEHAPLLFTGNVFALLACHAPQLGNDQRWTVQNLVLPRPNLPKTEIDEKVSAEDRAALPLDLSVAIEGTAARRRHTSSVEVPDVNALFLALVAPDEATQKTVVQVAGLSPRQALGPRSAAALVAQIERDFLTAALMKENSEELRARRLRLAQGLSHLAPHLAHADAAALWSLTALPAPTWEPTEFFRSTSVLKDDAMRADLYAALGLDERFDPALLYLPTPRHPDHGKQKEPLPGFVWVQKERADFQPKGGGKIALAPFLMARYLTTVDQFAAFFDGDGYKNPDWWDSQGWAWVTGEWDRHKATPKWLKGRLGQRPPEERQAPAHWAQQRSRGSRPVWGVNWFEARAYARWLGEQSSFKEQLKEAKLSGVRLTLPIEAQWERAATATGFEGPPDGREYVWGGEGGSAELRANIGASGLREASPVGLFPASPLGICDLNGNLWEWQDNLFNDKGQYLTGMRIPPLTSPVGTPEQQSDWLVLDEKSEKGATPALRGGAWVSTAGSARASIRSRLRPDDASSGVGFRVVLSLPN